MPATFGLALLAGAAGAQPAESPPDARAILAQARAALGSETALAAAADIEAELKGRTYAVEQAGDPEDMTVTAGRTYRWWFDADGGRALREAEQLFPGGVRFFTSAALTPAGGWSVDVNKWRTGVDLETVSPAGVKTELPRWERIFPHLALRQAAAAGESLKATAKGGLSYTDSGGDQIELSFDPTTRLMTSAAVMRAGVVQSESIYGDYGREAGVMLPRSVQQRLAGQLREDLRLGAVRFGQAPEARFAPPAGYAPPPASSSPATRRLAPGAWVFENMPGGYRSMVVDASDHLVVLEAPLSPDYAEAQKRLIAQIAPGKPVRYVVVTHPHGDHVGGLKTWAEAGAVIVVADGGGVAIRRQLVARNLTRGVLIEEVRGRRTLGAGAGRIDLHAFGSAHSRAHLLAHLPGSRLLFQGDMLYVPDRGDPPPAFTITGDLFEQIRLRKLDVQTVVGVHGRPATLAEARQSLERGRREGWGLAPAVAPRP